MARCETNTGITAVRFWYSKVKLNEQVFNGMCYISFANIPLLYAFINQFDGYIFDEEAETRGHGLRVAVNHTPLDASMANQSHVLGGVRLDEDVEDCPSNARLQQKYEDQFHKISSWDQFHKHQ